MTAVPYRPGSPPLGVAILAVLVGIVGAVYLIAGLILAIVPAFAPPLAPHFAVGWLAILLLILLGVVLLAVARGLWDLELWALVLSIIVVGLYWLSDLLSGAFLTLGGIVLFLVLVYLIAVHRYFR